MLKISCFYTPKTTELILTKFGHASGSVTIIFVIDHLYEK